MVSELDFLPHIKGESEFVPGNTKNCIPAWKSITSDKVVLDLVEGISLEFISQPPIQSFIPPPYKLDPSHVDVIDKEVQKLIDRGFVSEICAGFKFISNVFVVPKSNGKFRLIIDLSPLNVYIKKEHFKMDNLEVAAGLMFPGAFMASIDLKDAYYTLPIRERDKPFVCFQWGEKKYMFHVMPFGLTSAPRLFTKAMKTPLAVLRQRGLRIFGYIDDLFILADNKEDCEYSVKVTCDLLQSLGFFINVEKSSLSPSNSLQFLGFVLDTDSMRIFPTLEKVQKTKDLLMTISQPGRFKIRTVASLVGVLNDLTKGVDYGLAHIKDLEREKNLALEVAGDRGFEGKMSIAQPGRLNMLWWFQNLDSASRDIRLHAPTIELRTDASKEGWGGVSDGQMAQGRWLPHEKLFHINVLEILAVSRSLAALFPSSRGVFFKILCDNTTSIAYINKAGGTFSQACSDAAKLVWIWCQERDNWVAATHIPGVSNVEADFASRHFTDDTEWSLNRLIFLAVCRNWFTPDIDLFASRANHLLPSYVSWGPDELSIACDAFLLDWGETKINICVSSF